MISPPDEDNGICPKCKSRDTISSRAKNCRVCLSCEYSEDFPTYQEALIGWLPTKNRFRPAPRPDVTKHIERLDEQTTKIILLTAYRDDFNQWLSQRNIPLARPSKTEVWNNVESAYTDFELSVPYPIADQVFDEWVSGLAKA